MERKRIVILGAGFGGLSAVRMLGKRAGDDIEIVLIDKNDEHTYTPGLYETATTLRRDAEPLALKRASTIPVSEIISGLPVRFLQDAVEHIDTAKQTLTLRDTGALYYDRLIVAAGSRATDFGIQGVREHADFLKTFEDALKLRRLLTERLIDHRDPRILVVGGGASGVEVAGEIVGFAKQLCSRDGKMCSPAISILEGSDTLVRGLSPAVGAKARARLERLGVAVVFGARVTEVQQSAVHVTFSNNTRTTLPYDLLIWTAGIEPQPVCGSADVATDKRGRWIVDEYLRAQGADHVFAIGDITAFKDTETAAEIPATAYVAIGEGKVAAKNALASLAEKPLTPYRPPKTAPMVVPIGGKWAIAHFKPFVFSGFLPFLIRLAIDFKYFLDVLPFSRAWNFFKTSTRMYFSND